MSSAVPHVPSTPGVAPCWQPYCTTVVKMRLVVAAIVAVMWKYSNHGSSMRHQPRAFEGSLTFVAYCVGTPKNPRARRASAARDKRLLLKAVTPLGATM